jgi:hypothetical protein
MCRRAFSDWHWGRLQSGQLATEPGSHFLRPRLPLLLRKRHLGPLGMLVTRIDVLLDCRVRAGTVPYRMHRRKHRCR